jgi:hypothetical protein
LAAAIAVELIATGAEQRAASGAGTHFQEDVPAVLVVFDREALEECIAGGAGGGSEGVSHVFIMLDPLKKSKGNLRKILKGAKLSLRMAKKPKLSEAALNFFRAQGRRGGKLGGKRRAESLSSDRRAEIARKAAAARWGKKA